MARVAMIEGKPAIFCPACKTPHRVDTRWVFNYDNDKPTFRPELRFKVGPFPKGHELEGKTVVCVSKVERGQIHYMNESTHGMRGHSLALPDFSLAV